MLGEIISSIILVIGTLGGASIGVWSQREAKRLAGLQRRVDDLKAEIHARQCEEDVACGWLVELGANSSEQGAKLALHNRTEQEHSTRPRMSPGNLK